MSSSASTGNVIAAVCSFFIPGLGQLVQGRIMAAILHVFLFGFIYLISFGALVVLVNIYSCFNAAIYEKNN